MRARIVSQRYRKAWLVGLIATVATGVLAGAIATAGATSAGKKIAHPTVGVSIHNTGATPNPAEAGGAVRAISGCADNTFAANNDESIQAQPGFDLSLYGTSPQADGLWINNNGNLTFGTEGNANGTPSSLRTSTVAMIAPFWADVDTTGFIGSGPYGDTYVPDGGGSYPYPYGVQHPVLWGTGTLGGHDVFCVEWPAVGYDSGHTDKLNTFQVLLIDRSDTGAGNFDIE